MFKLIKFLIILAVVFLGVGFLSYQSAVNSGAGKIDKEVVFIVDQGEGAKEIARNLLDAGLIKSKFYFNVYIWRANFQSGLQAGEYMLNTNYNIKEIVDILVTGQILSDEKTIKIIEGWRINEIGAYLEDNNIAQSQVFINLAEQELGNWEFSDPKPDFLKSAPGKASLEGYLFPDTYKIFKDAAARDIIEKMLDNFNKKLTGQMREDIARQGRAIHKIIIMASLIEKEVRTEQDMKIVSGIFWDRIKNGQALESCATLAYILDLDKPQYTFEDTKINSPYNTYQNLGLPPGPICNSGLAAITAAIYPEYTDYNYFLNRPDTGETIFSKTYEEHLNNKARYLK